MAQETKPRLAVVGGGVAGIVSAYLLQQRYQVDLYESASYLGGHTNTVLVPDGADAGTAVDTGFIVFNLKTYPNFVRFLRQLGVRWQDSDMSFGYECLGSGWTYGGHDLNSLFADRANLLSPRFWKFVFQLLRFNRAGRRWAAGLQDPDLPLRHLAKSFSSDLVRHYLEPIGASIWSTPIDEFLDFPAQSFFRFFENHGLLQIWNRPQWLTVQGGSSQYIKAFLQNFDGRVLLDSAVRKVERTQQGATVTSDQHVQSYSRVVLATHADITLRLLAQPTSREQALLSPWRYQDNVATLHTDTRLLPSNPRARSSWNYRRQNRTSLPTLTYDMKRLQRLRTEGHYLVTLNAPEQIAPGSVIGTWTYHHPQFDTGAIRTQSQLASLNDEQLAFCGSYHGYGFHEDAVASAVRTARHLGVEW